VVWGSKHSLAHGPLLLLRNVVPCVPWKEVDSFPAAAVKLRAWLLSLLALVDRAATLAISVLQNPPNVGKPKLQCDFSIAHPHWTFTVNLLVKRPSGKYLNRKDETEKMKVLGFEMTPWFK
jgi:hypothetical protein